MLKKIMSILVFSLWIVVTSAYSYEIAPNKEYLIDGPANVRETPNGNIIYSLPDGAVVKVKKANFKWYLIEYNNDTNKDGAIILGWTYEENFKGPKGMPLSALIRQSKVVIANQKIIIHSHTSFVEFLGEKIPIIEGVAKPKDPIRVNIYCLNGSMEKNEIREIHLEYGGDAGAYLPSLKMKKKLTKNNCIVVNGFIDEEVATANGIIPDEKMIESIRPKALENYRGTEQAYTPEFTYSIGDFNSDGVAEVITNETHDWAPYFSKWDIYQIDKNKNILNLGRIGTLTLP